MTANNSVHRFFSHRVVFLTGGTGFLGRVVLEKLLRDLPEGGLIYVLIRPRMSASGVAEPVGRRLERLLAGPVFRRLRADLGTGFQDLCSHRLRVVEGDLAEPGLGLSTPWRKKLEAEVGLVIGCGASVVFDERLDLALRVNALAPLELMTLARAAGAPYVHVSTAYVSGGSPDPIPERIWEPNEAIDRQLPKGAPRPARFSPREDVERLVEESRQATAGNGVLVALGMTHANRLGFSDTYTFTKFLGEQLVADARNGHPVAIVRPSIVESTLQEPEPGWLDGLRMADPLIVGFGRGRIPDFPALPDLPIDLVPADLVARTVLTAAADADARGGLQVFHVATSTDNPITVRRFYHLVRDYFVRHPLPSYPGPLPQWRFPPPGRFRRRIEGRLLLPVRLARGALLAVPGSQRWRSRLRSTAASIEQLLYYARLYTPYTCVERRFATDEHKALQERLLPEEKERFGTDVMRIDWPSYIQDVHVPGLERFVLGVRRKEVVNSPPSPLLGRRRTANAEDERLVARAFHPPLMRRIVKASVMGSLDTLLACCIRLTVFGREHIPTSGPFVLAANHCSHLDTAMVRRALGAEAARLQVVAARDYFFTSPAKGWLFSALFNTLPWDRSGFPLRGLELCHRVLDGGHSILIFPEGTRSPSGTLQPFRPGIGVLAWELPYPVVPVHVAGTFRALPRGARILRPGPVTVRFGPALDVRSIKGVASLNGSAGPRSTPYRRAAAAIQAAVEELAP